MGLVGFSPGAEPLSCGPDYSVGEAVNERHFSDDDVVPGFLLDEEHARDPIGRGFVDEAPDSVALLDQSAPASVQEWHYFIRRKRGDEREGGHECWVFVFGDGDE